ncbi:hypothetical protein G7Y79_00010g028340 [Physcia stellaris]|nr:hypothetical protein G7Y79_00010g028340 [Physcia stellaris]
MGLFTPPPPPSPAPNSPSPTAPESAENDWGYAPSVKTQHGYLDVRNPSKNSFPMPKPESTRFHRRWYGYPLADREIPSSAAAQSWDRDVDTVRGPTKGFRMVGGAAGDDSEYEGLIFGCLWDEEWRVLLDWGDACHI